jgi:hypothetical protein
MLSATAGGSGVGDVGLLHRTGFDLLLFRALDGCFSGDFGSTNRWELEGVYARRVAGAVVGRGGNLFCRIGVLEFSTLLTVRMKEWNIFGELEDRSMGTADFGRFFFDRFFECFVIRFLMGARLVNAIARDRAVFMSTFGMAFRRFSKDGLRIYNFLIASSLLFLLTGDSTAL